jgi:hypothetical protein
MQYVSFQRQRQPRLSPTRQVLGTCGENDRSVDFLIRTTLRHGGLIGGMLRDTARGPDFPPAQPDY